MADSTVEKLSLIMEFSAGSKYTYSHLKNDITNEKLMDFAETIAEVFPNDVSNYLKSVEEHIV